VKAYPDTWPEDVAAPQVDAVPRPSEPPFWSVVVIARDEEATIADALRSVARAFGDRPHEIVFVDSASRDRTAKIAEPLATRVIVLPPDYPLRPSVGRHVGLRASHGKFVLFLDGDSILEPAWLEEAIAAFDADPGLAGVSGSSRAVLRDHDGNDTVVGDQYPDAVYDAPEHLSGSAAYRRTALDTAGGFDPHLYAHEEPELGARLRESGYRLRRLRTPMTRHFPKHRKESLAELLRRIRRGYPIGLGQFARHMLQRRVATPSPWTDITRHLQFATLLAVGLACTLTAIALDSWTPLLAWAGGMALVFAAFAVRARSVTKPAYYFAEWTLTSPFVVWGVLKRPRPIDEFSTRHPLEPRRPEESMPASDRSRIREAIFVLLLLLMGTIFTVLAAELMTRIAAPQLLYRYPRGFYESHPTRGYAVTPGFRATVDTPEYSVTYAFNRAGFRADHEYGPKPAGTFRVLLLGDSFTMGAGVEERDTFARRLEALLRERSSGPLEVVNTGIPGYGTREESILLAETIDQLAPDLVVLNFFVGNDLADNARPGLLQVIDEELVEREIPRGFLPLWVRGFLSRHSHLYHFLWPYQRMLLGGREGMRKEQRNALATYGPTNAPTVERIWQASQRWIDETIAVARKHDVPVAVVLIPDPLQVDEPRFAGMLSNLDLSPAEYARSTPDARLAEIATAAKAPVLDLLPAFERQTDPVSLYFPLDKHWTAAGHALAAEEMARFLAARNLVPTTR